MGAGMTCGARRCARRSSSGSGADLFSPAAPPIPGRSSTWSATPLLLRRSTHGGGHDLQRRGPGRPGRPAALRRAGRPARRQAGAGRGLSRDSGDGRRRLSLRRASSSEFYARRRRCSASPMAASCRSMPCWRATISADAHHGHGVRRRRRSCPASAWRSDRAAGGWIFDAYASYHWLFIGSALIGLGAAGIAIAFPPLPRRELQPA